MAWTRGWGRGRYFYQRPTGAGVHSCPHGSVLSGRTGLSARWPLSSHSDRLHTPVRVFWHLSGDPPGPPWFRSSGISSWTGRRSPGSSGLWGDLGPKRAKFSLAGGSEVEGFRCFHGSTWSRRLNATGSNRSGPGREPEKTAVGEGGAQAGRYRSRRRLFQK